MTKMYNINPVAKCRQTQRDKWLNPPRLCVGKYYAFKEQVALLKLHLPKEGAHVTFLMPMPKSWSKKKRLKMVDTYHKQVPDLDNLIKALGDAVYQDDSCISSISASKVWSEEGGILIQEIGEW